MSQLHNFVYERIKVRLEEYKSLRTETLQRLQTGTTLVNISIIVVTGLLSLNGLLLSKIGTEEFNQKIFVDCLGLTFGFLIPSIFLICGILLKYNDQVVERLGKYTIDLEAHINAEFNFILQEIDDSDSKKFKHLLTSANSNNVLEWVTSIQALKDKRDVIGYLLTLAINCFYFSMFLSLITLASFVILYKTSFAKEDALIIFGLAGLEFILSFFLIKSLSENSD